MQDVKLKCIKSIDKYVAGEIYDFLLDSYGECYYCIETNGDSHEVLYNKSFSILPDYYGLSYRNWFTVVI